MNHKKVNKELLKLNLSEQKLNSQRLFSKSLTKCKEEQLDWNNIMHSQLDESIVCKTNDKNWGIRMKNKLLVMMIMLIGLFIVITGTNNVYAACSACDTGSCGSCSGTKSYTNHTDTQHRVMCCCGSTVLYGQSHTGGTATCTSKKTCSKCGASYGEYASHKSNGLWYGGGAYQHYTQCSVCRKNFNYGSCSFTLSCPTCGGSNARCRTCYSMDPSHSCHTCSWSETGRTSATCTSSGSISYSCSCGATKSETIPALGHNWTSCPSCGTSGVYCNRCGSTSSHTCHTCSYNTLSSYSAPTCTTNGYEVYKCSCGDTVTYTLYATGHDYSLTSTTAATCTSKGSRRYDCDNCSDYYTESIAINSSAHSWNSGSTTSYPTCTSTGTKKYTCNYNSSHTKTETIAIDSSAHNWNSGTVTTQPTCSKTGVRTYTCTYNSSHTKTGTEPINSSAHNWNSGTVTTQPTCSKTGIRTYTCTYNSAHTTTGTEPINSSAHNWNSGTVTKQPTCSATGIRTYTCTYNSAHTTTGTEPINSSNHNYTIACTTCGEANIICSYNNSHVKSHVCDSTAPTINSLTASSTVYTGGNITLTGKATDSQSGIVGYAFTKGSASPSYISISATTSQITQTTTVTEADTYHFWVKDYAGNVNTSSVTISKKILSVPASTGALTYNGGSQSPSWNSNYNSSFMTLGGTTSGTNATSYNATFTLKNTSSCQWSDGTTIAKNVTWYINKKAVTITAKAQTITYGGSIATGTGQITVSGLVSGHSVTSITLTPSTSNATTTGTIAPSAAVIKSGSTDVTSNYSITYTNGALTINRASINVPSGPTLTYNGSSQTGLSSTTQYTVSGTSSATNQGTYTATVTPTANYKWDDNTTNAKNVTWNINKRAVTITAKAQTITYGGSITTGTGQITASGLVSGHSVTAITLTPSTSVVTTTGTITPSVATIKSGSTDVTSNYAITYVNGNLTINKKAVTITANAQTITYGGTIVQGVAQTTQTGLLSGHALTAITLTPSTLNATTTGKITPSGATIKSGSTDVTANYSITYVDGALTVNKKAVTITANAQTITYGENITSGVSQTTQSGLLSGHTLTAITLTPSTLNATTTGKITPSGATIKSGSTDVTSNYSITYVDGALTVNKKAVTITANAQTITYGGSIAQGVAQTTQSGLLSGHTLTAITLTPSTSVVTTTGTITPSAATIKSGSTDVTSNYAITYVNGNLTINKKAVTITANAQTITYGDNIATDVSQTTQTGLLSGHTLTAITLTPSISTVTTTGTITPSAAVIKSGSIDVTSNYAITYVNGNLTINKKAVTITANAQTITYGGTIAQGVAQTTQTGLLSGHALTAITLTPSIDEAGEGIITPSAATIKNGNTDVTSNYAITYNTGKLVINKKQITVTWGETDLLYKAKSIAPVVTTPINGVNGETIELIVSGHQTNVGNYTATVTISKVNNGHANKNNYTLTNPTIPFTISSDPDIKFIITLDKNYYVWDGSAHTPTPTVKAMVDGVELTLVKDRDYTVSYENNTEPGTNATVVITGINNYGANRGTSEFTIDKAIRGANVIMPDYEYDTTLPIPKLDDTREPGEVTYYFNSMDSNTNGTPWSFVTDSSILNAGTYYMYATIGETAHYKAETTPTTKFEIGMTTAVYPTVEDRMYNGHTQVGVFGSRGLVFTGVTEAINAGVYVAYAELRNSNYKWPEEPPKKEFTWEIKAIDINELNIDTGNILFKYDGKPKELEITIKLNNIVLTEGKDYTVRYNNNINVGEGEAVISGIGNFTGTYKEKIIIQEINLNRIELEKLEYNYTGAAIEPLERVYDELGNVLVKDRDYTVYYLNNVEKGTAIIGVIGKGNYKGNIEVTFEILGQPIDGAIVKLLGGPFVYDGNKKSPDVEITLGGKTLVRGRDFEISYDNNINAGENTALAIITGKGAYMGTINKNFTIMKADRKSSAPNGKGLVVGKTSELEFSYDGEIGDTTVVIDDTSIATVKEKSYINDDAVELTGVAPGKTNLKIIVAETDNYNELIFNAEITVFKTTNKPMPDENEFESAKPIYGTVVINDDEVYTVTPNTILTLNVDFADWMYISESNSKPSVDSSEWYEFSKKMPYTFGTEEGEKTVYVWFKDDYGTISEMATDSIILNYDVDIPVHDNVMLDQTNIDRTAPNVETHKFNVNSIDVKVTIKQKDTLVNGVRSGLDRSTIKYGYKEASLEGDYTWQTGPIIEGLKFNTVYAFVTQAYDRAGNGPIISEEALIETERKYETVITLKDVNIQFDGNIKEIPEAEFKLVNDVPITGDVIYTYFVDEACTIPTTPGRDGSVVAGAAPSRPGIYYVKVSLTGDNVYYDTESNVAELRIGWEISKGEDDDVFAYVERVNPDDEEVILNIIGNGEIADLADLLIKNTDESLVYWSDYKDKIVELDIVSNEKESVTGIGAEVFGGLTEITEIKLPDTVKTIGDGAFEGCTGITEEITIPAAVEKIGDGAFADVSTPGFVVEYGNPNYDDIDGVLTDEEHKELIQYPAGKEDNKYIIPDSIEVINSNSFTGADYLENVVIPNGVKKIEGEAFKDCTKLKVVEVEDLMNSTDNVLDLNGVGGNAFNNIAEDSIIYTFSEEVAKKFVSGTTYDPSRTKVYWPPVITVQPIDMNGSLDMTVKFIVEASAGNPEEIKYQWFKIKDGVETEISGATSNTYTTPALKESNDGELYYCRVYNAQYYYDRGFVNSNKAKLTMIEANYIVERGTYNSYLFEKLNDAFGFAIDDDVIKPIKSITEEDATLTGNKHVIIDMNNNTITLKGKIIIESGSGINIVGDGTIEKSGEYIIENKGDLIINGNVTINNPTGSGIKLNDGATLEYKSGNIVVDSNAIYAENANIKINGENAKITATTLKENVSAISLHGETKFDMTAGNISITQNSESTSGSASTIFIDGDMKGETKISGGTVKATSSKGDADAIINAGKSDVIISGTADISGSRSGIATTSTNKYGDIIIRGGKVSGGEFGVLNNAEVAKVVLGTSGGGVSVDTPVIVGEKVAIFNANKNNTLEYYDGVLYSHGANVIYETINNTNLEISAANTDSIYTETGRGRITTEANYSIWVEENASYNSSTYKKAILKENKKPTISDIQDQTVEIGEQATFEIIVTGGQPDVYEYQWEVSIDGGLTWSKVTVGTGGNTSKYTTPAATMAMDGNLYRCVVTNGIIQTVSKVVSLNVVQKDDMNNQRPVARIVFPDGKTVVYDGNQKYVNMQLIIKSFDKLESIEVNGERILHGEYKVVNGNDVYESTVYEYPDKDSLEITVAPGENPITIQKTINGKTEIVEYTYTYNMKAKVNDIITVNVVDMQDRDSTVTQAVDVFYDLKVEYTLTELSKTNNKMKITFFANKPVKPFKSISNSYSNSIYLDLVALDNGDYSYRYLLTLEEALDTTEFWFKDEYSNQTSVKVEELLRVKYNEIKFNEGILQIEDLTVVDAYNVAQELESITEINRNEELQSRYGLNSVQSDVFMSRARDLGSLEILNKSSSVKAYDGVLTSNIEAVVTSEDSKYEIPEETGNIYVAASAKGTRDNEFSKHDGKYVDIIIKDVRLYKGMDLSGFYIDDTMPYMYIDVAGPRNIAEAEIIESAFRATIIAK